MKKPVRILIVEDIAEDIHLAEHEIRRIVSDPEFQVAQTYESFLNALASFEPDVILSDYTLPHFDGLKALALAQSHAPLTPFIMWSGSISESLAVECMRAGANNYVFKDDLKRLGPAVLHALAERTLSLARQQAEGALKERERQLELLLDNLPGPVYRCLNNTDFTMEFISNGIEQLSGYQAQDFREHRRHFGKMIHPDDQARVWMEIQTAVDKRQPYELVYRIRTAGGEEKWVWEKGQGVHDEKNQLQALEGFITDITVRKQAEEKYQSIFENSMEGIFQSSSQGRYLNLNPAMARLYGYSSPEEMIASIRDIATQIYVEPDKRSEFTSLIQVNGKVENFEAKNYCKDGRMIWTSTSARAVCDRDGNVLYYEGFIQDITQRKQTEAALQKNEKRFRALIENGLDDISLLAADGSLLWESPSTVRNLGYQPAEFVGRNIFELMHPDDLEWTRNIFTTLLKHPEDRQRGAFRLRRADGTWRWVEAIATNLLNDDSVNAIVVNYRDITEQKQAEIELKQKNDDLALINTLNEAVNRGERLDAVMSRMREEFKRIFSSEYTNIYLLSPDGQSIKLHHYSIPLGVSRKIERVIGRTMPRIEIPVQEDGLFQTVLRSARSMLISDPHKLQQWIGEFVETSSLPSVAKSAIRKLLPQIYRILNIKSTVLIPLVSDGKALGVINVSSSGIFTEQDLKRIENICGQLTVALQRRQVEEMLNEERNLLRTLIDHLPDRIYAMDRQGRKTLSNTADWQASGGKTMEDVVGRTDFDLYPPEMAEGFWKLDKAVLDSGQPVLNHEEPGLDPDGNRVSILTTKIPLRDETGQVIGLVGIGRDITERKQTEERMNDLLAFNEKILNHSPIGILTYKFTGECVFVNENAAFIAGTSVKELKVHNFHTLESWKQSGLYDLVRTAMTNRSSVTADLHHRSIFGKEVWMTVHCVAFRLKEEDHVLLSIIDITERKRAEAALQASEARFRTLVNHATDGFFLHNHQGIILDVNQQACESLGYSREELLGLTALDFDAEITPDFFRQLREQLVTGEIVAFDTRHRRKDGTVFPVDVRIRSFWEEGQRYSVSLVRDITDRKQVEERLRQSENRYQLATKATNDVIWESNLQTGQLFWGPNVHIVFGYAPEEIDPHEEWWENCLHPNDRERVLLKLDDLIASNQSLWSEEYRFLLRDGSYAYISDRGYIERDATGTPLRMIGAMTNITERKQAETERQALLEIMQGLANTKDLQELLKLVHHSIAKVIYAENFYVCLFQENTGLFDEIYSVDQYDPPQPPSRLEHSITSYVFRSGEPLLLTQASFAELAAQGEVKLVGTDSSSWLGVPLKTSGRTIGVMAVQDYEKNNRYTEREKDFLTSIATQVALVIERKQAEEALRESEEHYRTVFEGVQDAIFVESLDGQILTVNERACEMFGYSHEEFLTKTVNDLIPPGHSALMAGEAEGAISTEPRETMNQRANGEIFPIEISGRVQVIHGQKVLLVVVRDITERKRSEAAEREQRILAEALRETAETLSRTLDYGEVLDHILTAVGRVVPHDAASILLIEQDSAQVVRSKGYDKYEYDPKIMGVKLPLTETVNLQQILDTRQPVVVWDTYSYTGWQRMPETDWLRSSVGAPISIYGKIIGFICLDSQIPGYFTPVHAERLEAFANQAAIAMHNARLLQQAQDEIAERKRSEDLLRQSEERFSNAFEYASIGMALVTTEGRWFRVNLALCSLLGYSEAELLQKTFQDITHPDDLEADLNYVHTLLRGEVNSYQMEKRYFHKSGQVVWVLLSVSLVRDHDGHPQHFISQIQDITERKRFETALMESNTQFQTLFEASPDAIVLLDPDENWSIIDCNSAACQMNGYTRQELIGQCVDILNLNPADRGERMEYLERVRQHGVLRYETHHRRKDGTILAVDVSTSIIRIGNRDIVLGIDRDITERKRAEEELHRRAEETRRHLAELRASEERFQQLADNIQEAFWITDAESGREIYMSPAMETIWWQPVQSMMKPDAYINSIFPEDRVVVLDAIEKEKHGEQMQLEYRILRPDGSLRWIWDRAFPIFDESGKVKRIAGISADITERKEAAEKLRESEDRYHSLFQNQLHGSALHEIIVDDQGQPVDYVFLKVNPAFEKMTGLTSQDIVGQRVTEVLPGIENEKLIPIYGQVALTGQPAHLSEYFAPLGRYYEINAYATGPRQFAVSFMDVTERRQAEQELRKLSRAVEQSSSTIIITDTSGNIEYVNPKFTEITGYSLAEVIGRNPRFLKSGFTAEEEYTRLWETIANGGEWHGELLNKRKDGTLYWESVTISPIMNDRREITHFVGVKEDITERKQSEIETRRHIAELEAVYENGLSVGRLLEPEEIGNRVIETFSRYLPWHHVTIRLRKEESDDLELVAFSLPHLKEEERTEAQRHFVARINKVGQGLSGWVIQTGTPLRTNNVHAHPQYIDTHTGIQSGLYMPLKVGERIIGVISVESEAPNAFTEQDERLLATLANQTAVAFENARLYEAMQKELSERKRAEDALRASEVHYRALADSITDILFELDQDLHYTHWNKASEALTGVPASDAIGKSMEQILGATEEQARIKAIFEEVLRNHQPKLFETNYVIGGENRSFEVTAYPSMRGVSVVAKDVTDRKRTESIMQKRFELMEYSARHSLKDLMQRTVDEVSELTGSMIGFFHFMEEDQIHLGMQTWSTSALRLFQVSPEDGAHLPLDQAGVWAEAVRQRRPLIQNDYESLAKKKGIPQGHIPILREIVIPIIRNERIMAVMGIGNKPQEYSQRDLEIATRLADYAWDITERKQMEIALELERNQLMERVEERTADLSRANSNLARALRVKDEFLANMSHELRTPLNAILGLSESLGEQIAGPLNEKQQKYISTISESGHHLLSLINDILDLAKIDAGHITLDINKVDIRSVCNASLRMIKQLAQKKDQEISLEIDDGLGLMWADERRLKQMIVNLLGNAVKFTPENGKLGLQVHGDEEANQIAITVWDNGIGIKEDDLVRLFQPFVQLDSGLAREATGTGLGLALVAQMARLHGGSVNVVSEAGKGSRFSILLPWEPALALDSTSRLKITGKFSAIQIDDMNKPTILLVEDTQEVVMMLKDYLELAGYKVFTAQDGVDGIVQARHIKPDLILMDVQMPRMNGFETTRKLRSDPNFRYTPIIALTALAMPHDRERCLEAGMDEYISKPVNLKALVKIIQSCLFKQESRTQ